MRLELEAEKDELIHANNLEKEDLISKYETEKQEAQEELEFILQVPFELFKYKQVPFKLRNCFATNHCGR